MIEVFRDCKKGAFLLLALTVLLLSASLATAQSRPSLSQNGISAEEQAYASIEEEMRAKRVIRAAEKAHQENLLRARNLSFIASTLAAECKEKGQLDREDLKKLEKAEKLARSIRSAAGGSEDDVELEHRPGTLSAALKMFAEVATSLRINVEKTSKHVVSTAVIDEANVILELLRIVRDAPAGHNP